MFESLILMDVDGVLNPRVTANRSTGESLLEVSGDRSRLLADVSSLGVLVWATSYGPGETAQLEAQAGITSARRIPLATLSTSDLVAPTPKLRRISRWVERTIAEDPTMAWKGLVWVDDHHKHDAQAWARTASIPVLLVTPDHRRGLTPSHVDTMRDWITGL